MIHGAVQVRVCERDAAEWCAAQDFAGGGPSVAAKEKSWLRIQIGVAPAIQNNCSNVALRIKSGGRKHFVKLFAGALLVFAERNAQHFRAAVPSLLFGG